MASNYLGTWVHWKVVVASPSAGRPCIIGPTLAALDALSAQGLPEVRVQQQTKPAIVRNYSGHPMEHRDRAQAQAQALPCHLATRLP